MGGECLVVSPSGDDFNSRPCLMHGVEYYLARSCHVSHVVNHKCKSEGKWCWCVTVGVNQFVLFQLSLQKKRRGRPS